MDIDTKIKIWKHLVVRTKTVSQLAKEYGVSKQYISAIAAWGRKQGVKIPKKNKSSHKAALEQFRKLHPDLIEQAENN